MNLQKIQIFLEKIKPYLEKIQVFWQKCWKIQAFRRVFRTFLGIWASFFVLNIIFPLDVKIDYSQIVLAEDGKILNAFLSSDEKWRMKILPNELTPELEKAFLNKEDKYFYFHLGVNPLAVLRAAVVNVFKNKKTSGASTISMQVARLLNPKERTYLNKIVEMFRALQLEWKFSKNEILSLYLNLVPYGSNIEGIKSASILFFGKTPEQLSLAQIMALTIIPNRPTSLAIGKHNDRILEERNKWLKRFAEENVFENELIESALIEPLNAQRQEAPAFAPHFSTWIHQIKPFEDEVKTTIKLNFQSKVEEICGQYLQKTQRLGIHNSAVLVLDNKNRKVVAYLGSPNFKDDLHAGQVDGVRSIHSPGSALKPILYGLSFDVGKTTPKFVVSDVPTDFEGYQPENYNQNFNGNINIEKSLAYSLNIPAVRVLKMIGMNEMISSLKKANFSQIRKDEKKLGLSLALGGCGVSLWEMAGLYASFANQGKFLPLQYLANDSVRTDTTQILSPSASFMINDILSQVTRPDMPSDYESNPHVPKIAWKTGTSYGRRDAWSIGYNGNYTVAVWIGNFDAEGAPELTGASLATPLLFKIFNAIEYNSAIHWFSKPQNLEQRTVCVESGLPPSEFCQNTIKDYFLAGISPSQACEHLQNIFVSPDEKMSFCGHCVEGKAFVKKLYPNLSAEMIAFYDNQGVFYSKIPPHSPTCTAMQKGNAPKIISPVDKAEYLTIDQEEVELLLNCQAESKVQKVFWYINNQFYKSGKVGEKIFFKPKKGISKISCSDDQGRNSNIEILVK